jgi:hypothetical protein
MSALHSAGVRRSDPRVVVAGPTGIVPGAYPDGRVSACRQPTRGEVQTMTAEEADAGLTQLLRLPPVRVQEEPVIPGRQGGLAVAAMGAVLTVIGVLLGLAQPDAALARTDLALIGLGIVEIAIGMILVPLGRLDRQPSIRVADKDRLVTERRSQVTPRSRILRSSRKSVIV